MSHHRILLSFGLGDMSPGDVDVFEHLPWKTESGIEDVRVRHNAMRVCWALYLAVVRTFLTGSARGGFLPALQEACLNQGRNVTS